MVSKQKLQSDILKSGPHLDMILGKFVKYNEFGKYNGNGNVVINNSIIDPQRHAKANVNYMVFKSVVQCRSCRN